MFVQVGIELTTQKAELRGQSKGPTLVLGQPKMYDFYPFSPTVIPKPLFRCKMFYVLICIEKVLYHPKIYNLMKR